MFDSAPVPTRPRALQQHPHFVAALQAVGRKPCVVPGSQPLVILQRQFGGRMPLTMLSRAPLDGLTPASLRACLSAAGLARAPLILSPDGPAPLLDQLGALPLMTPAWVAEVDLTTPKDMRRDALHPKWRNRLVRGESNGLRVTRQTLPLNLSHPIWATDAAQQRQRGYRGWPASLTLAYAMANPGQAKLFTAFDGRDPVAQMLFLRHGGGATYHIGHTTGRGRALSAHNLLLWNAMCWLAAKGHRRLDLGLISTDKAPGLARFKLATGATARALGGTWLWWPPLGRALRPLAALDRRAMLSRWTAGSDPDT